MSTPVKTTGNVGAPIQVGTQIDMPWGWYMTTYFLNSAADPEHPGPNDVTQTKVITVNPGQSLLLQYHNLHTEHWVIVRGTARVFQGNTVRNYAVTSHIFIPTNSKHKIENTGAGPLILMEVSVGSNVTEDDTVFV